MNTRKSLSILLAVCIALTSVPMTVWADVKEAAEITQDIVADAEQTESASPSDAAKKQSTDTPAAKDRENKLSKYIELTATAADGVIVTMKAETSAFVSAKPASPSDAESEDEFDIDLLSLKVEVVDLAGEQKAEETLEKETKDANVAKRATYDICVLYDGREIEPLPGKKVELSFALPEAPSGADEVTVYHHAGDGIETIINEKIETADGGTGSSETDKENESAKADLPEVMQNAAAEGNLIVSGATGSFSLYTVDFTYNEKTISIPGDTDHNKLSDILAQVDITEAIEEAKAYQDAGCTVLAEDGIVKDVEGNGLFKVYCEGGEWYVDALSAFRTEHGLLIKTANAEYKIRVTDTSGSLLTFTANSLSILWFDYSSALEICYGYNDDTFLSSYHRNEPIFLAPGNSVSFSGRSVTTNAAHHFRIVGDVSVSGTLYALTGGNYEVDDKQFSCMFYYCAGLTDASNLDMISSFSKYNRPEACFEYMFCGCTGLTKAPKLPLTTLTDGIYQYMFANCTSLTTAPALPVLMLTPSCYEGMFSGCTSLIAAPELPASVLNVACYKKMFCDCTSLREPPALPSGIIFDESYASMFEGCTAMRLLYAPPGDPYRIPSCEVPPVNLGAGLTDMFKNTGGDNIGTPNLSTTYYVRKQAMVTYDVQGVGTAPASGFTGFGETVSKPSDPTASGCTFAGWYKEKECINPWNFDTDAVNTDITLYAKWTAALTFSLGGHGENITKDVKVGSKAEKPGNPSATGYVFAGWYKDPDHRTLWDFDSDTVSQNTTIYSKWTDKNFTVTFNYQGHGGTDSQVAVREGESVTRPENPKETGWIFGGWYTEPTCDNKWEFSVHKVQGETILYAKWTKKNFTVSFNASGHGTAPEPQTVQEGQKAAKPATDPSATGYTFAGWYKESGCTTPWVFDSDTVTSDVVLYAKWTDKMFTVTYDVQELGTAPQSQSIREGEKMMPPEAPTCDGWMFAGWYKESGCTTLWDFAGDVVTKNTTLYARWIEGSCLIITATSVRKVYDGQLITPSYTCEGQLVDGDKLELSVTGKLTPDAGIEQSNISGVSVLRGSDDVTSQYNIVMVPGVLVIEPKPLTVTGTIVTEKIYNGKTDAGIASVGTVGGIIGSDDVAVEATATFAGPDVGDGISVYVEYSLSGTKAANYCAPASQTITGKILPKNISGTEIDAVGDQTYTGKEIRPEITVKDGDRFLEEGSDYTVSFSSNLNEGTAKASISGKGNYSGTKEISFGIVPGSIGDATICEIPAQKYTGTEIKPGIKVTFGGNGLTENKDYTVTYTSNVNAGTAIVSVTGMGNFKGVAYGQFTVEKRKVTMTSASAVKTYDGNALTNDGVTESGDGFVAGQGAIYAVTGSQTAEGSSKNSFYYILKPGTEADNYEITQVEGTLRVTAAEDEEESVCTTDTGTGTWTLPATGTWTKDAEGNWIFGNRGIARFTSTWGYILHAGMTSSDWYYFGEDGKMKTGFQTIGGKVYYLRETKDSREGAMETGFQTIGGLVYYFDEKKNSEGGAMATGWKTIGGKDYYFGTDGVLWTGRKTPDGKTVGTDGARID